MKAAIIIVCCFAAALGYFVGDKKKLMLEESEFQGDQDMGTEGIGYKISGKKLLTPEEVNSREFQSALDMATLEMNRVSNHPRFHAVFSLVQGTKQLVTGVNVNGVRVSGVLYEFSVILRATSCENLQFQNPENLVKCVPDYSLSGSEFHCIFQMLHQPWGIGVKYRMVSEPVCMSHMEKSRLPFAVPFAPGQKVPLTPEEISSPMFQGAMTVSAVHFNQHSQLANLHSLIRYDRATKQVVSGMLLEFDGLFAETICENRPENHGKGIEECALGNSPRIFSCPIKILFKAWGTPKYTVLEQKNCQLRV